MGCRLRLELGTIQPTEECNSNILASLDAAEHARVLLDAIVASSDDAVVSKTLTGIVISWNAAAERLFGFTAAEMVGPSHASSQRSCISRKRRSSPS